MKKQRFLQKKEWLVLGGVVLLALVALMVISLVRAQKTDLVAKVVYDNTTIDWIDLNQDGEYHYEGELPVTLLVEDQSIRFINSQCPDHDCELVFGTLTQQGDYAICLPALVGVYLVEPESA